MKKLIRETTKALADLMPGVVSGAQIEFFSRNKITNVQFITLMAIYYPKRCTMGYLARTLHVTMPTASGLVARLVKAGLVRRTLSEQDRRRVYIELTDKGIRLIQGFQSTIKDVWNRLLSDLPPKEVRYFKNVIEKVKQNIEKKKTQKDEK